MPNKSMTFGDANNIYRYVSHTNLQYRMTNGYQ